VADIAFVALGSNLGDRRALLSGARDALSRVRATRLIAVSRVEETAPFGTAAQGPYLNQMVALRTALAPHSMLAELHRVERSLGRVRRCRWGPRTIDLDLVRQGTHTVCDGALTLPHPGIASRDFWRRELAELAALTEPASASVDATCAT
jgi:2-amino-4-hydroxy-6-hydroxymethyldihydropteridine diphosphokinase